MLSFLKNQIYYFVPNAKPQLDRMLLINHGFLPTILRVTNVQTSGLEFRILLYSKFWPNCQDSLRITQFDRARC